MVAVPKDLVFSMFCEDSDSSDDRTGGSGSGYPLQGSYSLDSIVSRSDRLLPRHEDYNGDEAAFELMQLAGYNISSSALRLGKFMREHFESRLVKYAMLELDSVFLFSKNDKFSKRDRARAYILLKFWLRTYDRHELSESVVNSMLGTIERLVPSSTAYVASKRLICSQQKSPVTDFGGALTDLGGVAHYFKDLPKEIRKIFKEIVNESIRVNSSLPESSRRQYNNLGNIVRSFEHFTRPHHKAAYDLVSMISNKDERKILFDFYKPIGRFSPDAQDSTINLARRVLKFVPESAVMCDSEATRAHTFMDYLAEVSPDAPKKVSQVMRRVWSCLSRAELDEESGDVYLTRTCNYLDRFLDISPKAPAAVFRLSKKVWDYISEESPFDPDELKRVYGFMESISCLAPETPEKIVGLVENVWRYIEKGEDLAEHELKSAYKLVENIISLPQDITGDVVDIIEKYWSSFRTGNHLAVDLDDKDLCFMKNLAKAFEHHTPTEISCFFDLYQDRCFDSDFEGAARNFYEAGLLLARSTRVRKQDKDIDEILAKRKKKRDEDRAGEIGLEYLLHSASIDEDTCNPRIWNPVEDFARCARSFYRMNLGKAYTMVALDLYKRGILEMKPLEQDERSMLDTLLDNETGQITIVREFRRGIDSLKPIPCPSHLKKHIERNLRPLRIRVKRLWDLRNHQHSLYTDSAIGFYDQLARRQADPEFVQQVVQELSAAGILEKYISVFAGGCGFANTEIAFHETLKQAGHDVHLTLCDKSEAMRKKAVTNCRFRGIRPDRTSLDLQELNYKDLKQQRQVVFTLFGGTFFNWLNRYEAAESYAHILARRDKRIEEKYCLERYGPERERKPDILLIEGDVIKSLDHYKSRSSKRFLASGLSAYDLSPNALMKRGRLCHTLYLDEDEMEVHCIYVVTKRMGRFEPGDALMVIDSGNMYEEEFRTRMSACGFHSRFVYNSNNDDKAIALCVLEEYKDALGEETIEDNIGGQMIVMSGDRFGVVPVLYAGRKQDPKGGGGS